MSVQAKASEKSEVAEPNQVESATANLPSALVSSSATNSGTLLPTQSNIKTQTPDNISSIVSDKSRTPSVKASDKNSVSGQNLGKAGLVLLLILLALGVLAVIVIFVRNNSKNPQSTLYPKSTNIQNETPAPTPSTSGLNENYRINGQVMEIDKNNRILSVKSDNESGSTVYQVKITDITTFIGSSPGLPVKVIDNNIVYPSGKFTVRAKEINFDSINLGDRITADVSRHSDGKLPDAIIVTQE